MQVGQPPTEDLPPSDPVPWHRSMAASTPPTVYPGAEWRQDHLSPPRVWNVRYNHSHDQLILTGSSDSRVILSNMVSISSEPFGHLVDDDDLSDQEERHPEEK